VIRFCNEGRRIRGGPFPRRSIWAGFQAMPAGAVDPAPRRALRKKEGGRPVPDPVTNREIKNMKEP